MKNSSRFSFIFSLVAGMLFCCSAAFGQYYITVSSITDNPTSPSSGELRWAINQAISHANSTGDDVIIQFDAPGLCQALDDFPTITLTNGSILFERKPSASVPQGIDANWLTGPAYNGIINILNNSTSHDPAIEFLNLNFKNYSKYEYFIQSRTGASLMVKDCNFYNDQPSTVDTYLSIAVICWSPSNSQDATITNCNFSGYNGRNSIIDLELKECDNVTVSGCTFDRSLLGGQGFSNIILTNADRVNSVYEFHDNTFIGPSNSSTTAIVEYFEESTSITNIYNNTFTDGACAIEPRRHYDDISNTATGQLFIHNNTMSDLDYAALSIASPKSNFILEDNTFNNNVIDISVWLSNGQSTNLDVSDFRLETGTGNIFNSHNGSSPSIDIGPWNVTDRKLIASITGQDLKGRISCSANSGWSSFSTVIRDNKIVSNGTAQHPISRVNLANAQNTPPLITSASLSGGNSLSINYTLSGLITTDQPHYVVDFYIANANGDLVSYLGNSGNLSYTTINNNHNSVLTVSGVTTSTRIAATVTSYPDQIPTVIYGTSEIGYFNGITMSSYEYNTPCTAIDLSCEDNNLTFNAPPSFNQADVWYVFQSYPISTGCSPSIDFSSTGKIGMIEVYQSPTCNLTGITPYFSVFANNLTYTLNASNLPAGLLFIHVVVGTPGFAYNQPFTINANAANDFPCTNCIGEIPCEDCLGSFLPEEHKEYIISAWVREDGAPAHQTSMPNPKIIIEFPSITTTLPAYYADGPVIEGWQKIYGKFVVPTGATDIKITLDCDGGGQCLFDDVRVFPSKGMMKSYVYDPINLRFVAELDEENYASFYEYDEEGQLTTVKKETERGVMTIQESRSKIWKRDN